MWHWVKVVMRSCDPVLFSRAPSKLIWVWLIVPKVGALTVAWLQISDWFPLLAKRLNWSQVQLAALSQVFPSILLPFHVRQTQQQANDNESPRWHVAVYRVSMTKALLNKLCVGEQGECRTTVCLSSSLHETRHLRRQRCITCPSQQFARLFFSHSRSRTHPYTYKNHSHA